MLACSRLALARHCPSIGRPLLQPFSTYSDSVPKRSLIPEPLNTVPGGGRGVFELGEDQQGAHIRFDVPGLSKDHVKVWSEGRTVCIRAEGPRVEGAVRYEWVDVAKGRL